MTKNKLHTNILYECRWKDQQNISKLNPETLKNGSYIMTNDCFNIQKAINVICHCLRRYIDPPKKTPMGSFEDKIINLHSFCTSEKNIYKGCNPNIYRTLQEKKRCENYIKWETDHLCHKHLSLSHSRFHDLGQTTFSLGNQPQYGQEEYSIWGWCF